MKKEILVSRISLKKTNSPEEFYKLLDIDRKDIPEDCLPFIDLLCLKSIKGSTKLITQINFQEVSNFSEAFVYVINTFDLKGLSLQRFYNSKTISISHIKGNFTTDKFLFQGGISSKNNITFENYIENTDIKISKIIDYIKFIDEITSEIVRNLYYENENIELKNILDVKYILIDIDEFHKIYKVTKEYFTDEIEHSIQKDFEDRYSNRRSEDDFRKYNLKDTFVGYNFWIYLMPRSNYKVDIAKRDRVLSPLLSTMSGFPLVPDKDIVAYLGETKTSLARMFRTLAQKEYTLTFLGVGGTTLNFLYWTDLLLKYANKSKIFRNTLFFDEDSLELHNLPRIPFDITRKYKLYYPFSRMLGVNNIVETKIDGKENLIDSKFLKANVFTNDSNKLLDKSPIPKLSIIPYEVIDRISKRTYDSSSSCFSKRWSGQEHQQERVGSNIYFGSPDIETRDKLFNNLANDFLCVTHNNNYIQLTLNPEPVNIPLIENYGVIDLNVFFLNQLKVTLSTLRYLAYRYEDDRYKEKKEEKIIFSRNLN